ncbi:hypothetical protein HY449_02075 [Candidatus Pacearchaeota archaeon]|nr:hypothetical protein [Candidatus Pacearchaeota archaeon]
MVKLEGLTQEEIKERRDYEKWQEERRKNGEKQKRIVKITRNMFGSRVYTDMDGSGCTSWSPEWESRDGGWRRIGSSSLGWISIYTHRFDFKNLPGSSFQVYCDDSRIFVKIPKYLNDALRLAQAYEEAGFGEFTVKKEYEE